MPKHLATSVLALVTATLLLLGSATACEYLEESAPAGQLPPVDTITRDAKKYNQSPFEVLDRYYRLRTAQLETNYERRVVRIDERLATDTITNTIAETQKNLAQLEHKQDQLELDLLYEQRKAQLNREKDRLIW